MGTFFAYMLKSALCLVAYYLFYKLLLSRDTFYHLNRFALVLLLMCSMFFPFMRWTRSEVATGSGGVATFELPMVAEIVSSEVLLWDKLMALLLLVYFVGIIVVFLRTLVSYLSLGQIIRHCEEHSMPNPTSFHNVHLMVTTEKVSPFSWMNYIVVNDQDLTENSRSILLHEMGHIRHHHTLDLFLTELCTIVQWFNPAIWLIREELQNIHEFEADEAVLNAGVNAREYQLLLIKKAAGSRLQSITNSLHQSSIKKRITMMQKKKSNPWARAKYAFAVPVAALSAALLATPTASALTAEISGCKVSDLFSLDQDNNPKNYVTIVYQTDVEGYSAHQIGEKGAIQAKVLTDEDLKEIYKKDGQLALKLTKETPMQYVSDLKKRCRNLDIIKLSYSDSESIHLVIEQTGHSSSTPSAGDDIKTVCEVEPMFPGGTQELMKFIAQNLRYPAECAEKTIEGRVILSFIVEKDGSVSNIEKMRSPDERLTDEAIRVVSSMPKWIPGKQDGKEVRVKYVLPFTFRLNNDTDIDNVSVADNSAAQPRNSFAKGLFLVDGKVVSKEAVSNLRTADIQSVDVLKDDASIIKYVNQYPEAKNGVFIITLKKCANNPT